MDHHCKRYVDFFLLEKAEFTDVPSVFMGFTQNIRSLPQVTHGSNNERVTAPLCFCYCLNIGVVMFMTVL